MAEIFSPSRTLDPDEYQKRRRDNSRGIVFVWICVWISDLILEIPLEHYASLVLAVSVLNTSLQQNLLTRGDLSYVVLFAVVMSVLCYYLLPEAVTPLMADVVLLGYASSTLTGDDVFLMVPMVFGLDTVLASFLREHTLEYRLLLCLSIGIGSPLVVIAHFTDDPGRSRPGSSSDILAGRADSDFMSLQLDTPQDQANAAAAAIDRQESSQSGLGVEAGVTLELEAVKEAVGRTLKTLSNYLFISGVNLLASATTEEMSGDSKIPPDPKLSSSRAEEGMDTPSTPVGGIPSRPKSTPPESSRIPMDVSPITNPPSAVASPRAKPPLPAKPTTPRSPIRSKPPLPARRRTPPPAEKSGQGSGSAPRQSDESREYDEDLTLLTEKPNPRSLRRRKGGDKKVKGSPARSLRRSRRVKDQMKEVVMFLSGENLQPMSRWRSTIDAFVQVHDEESRIIAQTQVVRGSLEPKWLPIRIPASPGSRLQLRVMHSGVVSSYILGYTIINIPNKDRLPFRIERDLYLPRGGKLKHEGEACRLDVYIHPSNSHNTMAQNLRLEKMVGTGEWLSVSRWSNPSSNPYPTAASPPEEKLGSYWEPNTVADRHNPMSISPTGAKASKQSGTFKTEIKQAPPEARVTSQVSDRKDPLIAATQRLKHGVSAYKHTAKGRKHRWVRLSKDGYTFEWWAADRSKRRGGIAVDSIIAVAAGWQTSVFSRACEDMDDETEELCMSFVGGDRTLDLELESREARSQWVRDVMMVTGLQELPQSKARF